MMPNAPNIHIATYSIINNIMSEAISLSSSLHFESGSFIMFIFITLSKGRQHCPGGRAGLKTHY